LGRLEEQLDAIPDLHVLHLRPGLFMENLYTVVPMIKQGFIATPLQADLAMPWIATADVGDVAASELSGLAFKGKTIRELHGARDMTYEEAVRTVSKAVGKELRYVQASYDEAEKSMVQTGLKPALAKYVIEMYRAMNERRMKPLESRTDRTTTPTS